MAHKSTLKKVRSKFNKLFLCGQLSVEMRVKDDNDTMVVIGHVQSVENIRKSDAGGGGEEHKKERKCIEL